MRGSFAVLLRYPNESTICMPSTSRPWPRSSVSISPHPRARALQVLWPPNRAAEFRYCQPSPRVGQEYRTVVAEFAALRGPEAMSGAGGPESAKAILGARAGAGAAVHAAAAVRHGWGAAESACAGAGAAARRLGRIAAWRPVLQAASPLCMGFYRHGRSFCRRRRAWTVRTNAFESAVARPSRREVSADG